MSVRSFLDTNILVYAAYPADGEQWKQAIALQILERENYAVSSQVMLEFLNVTTRKRKPGISLHEAREWLVDLGDAATIALDRDMIVEAFDLASRYRIVFWDGAVLVAASRSGAKILYTEDLNDGQLYGDVRVVNPFKSQPN